MDAPEPKGISSLLVPGKARSETLTDGIFAIAMTLLILNINVPPAGQIASAVDLVQWMRGEWHNYLTYFFAFVTLGIYWIQHHNVFHAIDRVDHALIWMNVHFLLFIAFLPFSTRLADLYYGNPVAIAVFGLNLIVLSALLLAIWRYAEARRFVHADVSPAYAQLVRLRLLAIPIVAILSMLLTIMWIPGSLLIYLLLLPFYAFPGRIDRKTEEVLSGDGQIRPFMGVRAPAVVEKMPSFKPFGKRT
ncbi:MAG TPA: TMEM175 family protein [Fimbriimonadaceae bacterium]|nr:TMEM175 family protein [Fimbriimonadaceae bacterium]